MTPVTCYSHVLVVVLVSCMVTVHAQSCTKPIIEKCLVPLKNVTYDVSSAVVPYLDEASMKDHCDRYQLFENCMVDVRPYCGELDKLVFQGVEDAYQWMCVDGFDEYLEHRNCFKNTKLHSEGEVCNQTLTTSLKNIQGSSESSSYKRERICQYFEQYLDCVENVVTSFCDADAAKWQRTMDVKSLNPTATRLGCRLTGWASSWVKITMAVVLTLSILIIIVSIVLVCMQRRKRRLMNNTRDDRGPGAPPPYEGPSPYTVQYDGAAANIANGTPVTDKTNIDPNLQPPPYYQPNEYSTPVLSPAMDDGVAAGYFGASASGVSPTEPEDKQALARREVTAGDLPDKNKLPIPMYDDIDRDNIPLPIYEEGDPDISGFSNPSFDDVEALGYFGSAPSKTSS